MGYQHRVHGECAIGHCILLSKSTPFDLRSSKMKYFALLMVVGLAAASSTGLGRELKFDAGKEYLFQYSGRLMSGIPELANQYSGLAINATVGLIAKSQTTLSLVVSAPKFVKINDVLNSEESVPSTYGGTNWRRMVLPEMLEVPEEFKRILAMPVLVELGGETGAIRAVKVSKSEPEWSVNYKKGIVSLFQVKMESSLSSNMIETSSEIRPFWKVMEETVSGKCLATYQANQLPEYMVKENPMLIPHPEACPEKKFYEVIRTVDFTSFLLRLFLHLWNFLLRMFLYLWNLLLRVFLFLWNFWLRLFLFLLIFWLRLFLFLLIIWLRLLRFNGRFWFWLFFGWCFGL